MASAVGPEDPFNYYLLGSFAMGVLLAAKCLVQMAIPRLRVAISVELVSGFVAFLLVFILGLDAFLHGGVLVAVASPLRFWIVTGTSVSLVAAHLGVSLLHGRRQLALQPIAWLAVALTLAATAWSSHRYSVGKLRTEIESFCIVVGELEPLRDRVAVTDRGREVTLFRWESNDTYTSTSPSSHAELENLKANCHGWVFVEGQHFLGSAGVEKILQDNGYQHCHDPRPGDVIIYRDEDGAILHTGLVKAGIFGETLIDSKWGLGGRFMHSPDQQPYGNRYDYYRSSRQGHTLAIVPAKSMIIIASR